MTAADLPPVGPDPEAESVVGETLLGWGWACTCGQGHDGYSTKTRAQQQAQSHYMRVHFTEEATSRG